MNNENKDCRTVPKHSNEAFRIAATPPSLEIDWDAYEAYLDGHDLTDTEKRELVTALLEIVVSFVDLGFAVTSPDRANDEAHPAAGQAAQTDQPRLS